MQEPTPAGAHPRGISWMTVMTACLVSVGLVLLAIGGVKSLGGAEEPFTSEEFLQIQQITNEQLDAMSEEQLVELLHDLDDAEQDHAAPVSAVEMEQLRIQGIWEVKWYGNEAIAG
ncbi:hypothetical protein LG293_15795 (plasmid) [Citricoccus nitrophenolicus]